MAEEDPSASEARRAVLLDPLTADLIARLPDWERDPLTGGHNHPVFAPNLLALLHDRGMGRGDDSRVDAVLEAMLAHQDDEGRFLSLAENRLTGKAPAWGRVLCDSHAVCEVLVRFGYGDDPRAQRSLEAMGADLEDTAQGPGWRCLPHSLSGWRGPGRKGDVCLQVTIEALRTAARLPVQRRPSTLDDQRLLAGARTLLRAWRVRGQEKPYMFGHGRRFKTTKWPATWYDVHTVLDAVSRFPALWQGGSAVSSADGGEDRRALAELAACLVAYNFGPEGTVTPRSCYQGFSAHSFGQKKRPSAYVTAKLCAVLRRLDALVDEIRAVDVTALPSSLGGAGTALPPR